MINYNEIKEKIGERKPKLVYASFVLVAFLVGFGAGRANPERDRNSQKYTNYNTSETSTKVEAKPENSKTTEATSSETKTASDAKTTSGSGQTSENTCTGIKGNISGKTKTYHIPGGSFYARTQEEQCFKTEEEAVAAGFTKAKR